MRELHLFFLCSQRWPFSGCGCARAIASVYRRRDPFQRRVHSLLRVVPIVALNRIDPASSRSAMIVIFFPGAKGCAQALPIP